MRNPSTDWRPKRPQVNGHDFRRARFSRAERVIELRDATLKLLYAHHNRIDHGGTVLGAQVGKIHILLRTPGFFGWRARASYPMLSKQLPFNGMHGLDVWMFRKVLNIEWDPTGRIEIVSFQRGPWEALLLLEAQELTTGVALPRTA